MTSQSDLTDREQQAFTFAADSTKQLITLAVAILGITVTFRTELGASGAWGEILAFSWVCFVLSIVCGMWTMLALTGELEPVKDQERRPSIWRWNVRLPVLIQLGVFSAGIVALLIVGVTAPTPNQTAIPEPPALATPVNQVLNVSSSVSESPR